MLPGIATATELLRAVGAGLGAVKLFPAGLLGGPALVRAFSAIWPDVRFMPTGGVTAATAPDYLALAEVLAVGGSWMVNAATVGAQDWTTVAADAAAAADVVSRIVPDGDVVLAVNNRLVEDVAAFE